MKPEPTEAVPRGEKVPVTDEEIYQAAREILEQLCSYTVCEPDNTEVINLAITVIEKAIRPLAGRPRATHRALQA